MPFYRNFSPYFYRGFFPNNNGPFVKILRVEWEYQLSLDNDQSPVCRLKKQVLCNSPGTWTRPNSNLSYNSLLKSQLYQGLEDLRRLIHNNCHEDIRNNQICFVNEILQSDFEMYFNTI